MKPETQAAVERLARVAFITTGWSIYVDKDQALKKQVIALLRADGLRVTCTELSESYKLFAH